MKLIALSITFVALSLCINSSAFADCDRDQAFNKMIKINSLSAKLQSEVPRDPRTDPDAMNQAFAKIKKFSDMFAPTGQMLADGKYNEVCAIYEKIAATFNFDLDGTKSLTMDQLRADGGKSVSGDCDISEMAKRTASLMEDFKKAYEAGRFSDSRQRDFAKDSEVLSKYGSVDPGRVCREIVNIRAKYGL